MSFNLVVLTLLHRNSFLEDINTAFRSSVGFPNFTCLL